MANQVLLDKIISKLQGAHDPMRDNGSRPCPLSIEEVTGLCTMATNRFKSQRSLLQLDSPMIICGDIHGQFTDLMKLFEIGGAITDRNPNKYLFMGYV